MVITASMEGTKEKGEEIIQSDFGERTVICRGGILPSLRVVGYMSLVVGEREEIHTHA